MLIEWTLLNEFETSIKKGDFRLKLINSVKNDEYQKFLIYNNPSFVITKFAEVCLDIAFAKINSVIFLF